jgi:hypothetical protein
LDSFYTGAELMPKPIKQSIKPPRANISLTAMTKVEGKMNQTDAGKVGQLLALSLL